MFIFFKTLYYKVWKRESKWEKKVIYRNREKEGWEKERWRNEEIERKRDGEIRKLRERERERKIRKERISEK